ncbi:hypothetical protein [Chryseobacterium sp. OV279]|uniref:hypothetical protein n=1 Tax=Chryseobacterium sp. OV279 TaxID=1500285 RepID=UPI000934FA3F|nr:hypothetical protein [Chryseobacterium sp. OV279]
MAALQTSYAEYDGVYTKQIYSGKGKDVAASLDLEEAFTAAHLLHAGKLVPIHYSLFEHEKFYLPKKFDQQDLQRLFEEIGQQYIILKDGKILDESENNLRLS